MADRSKLSTLILMRFNSKPNRTPNFVKPEFSTKSGQAHQWRMKGPKTKAQFIHQEAPAKPENKPGHVRDDVLSIHLNPNVPHDTT